MKAKIVTWNSPRPTFLNPLTFQADVQFSFNSTSFLHCKQRCFLTTESNIKYQRSLRCLTCCLLLGASCSGIGTSQILMTESDTTVVFLRFQQEMSFTLLAALVCYPFLFPHPPQPRHVIIVPASFRRTWDRTPWQELQLPSRGAAPTPGVARKRELWR